MTVDPHELRMAAGQSAAASLEALDDHACQLLTPVAESLTELTTHLRAQGLTPMAITQLVIGMIIGAAYHEHGEGGT